MSNNKEIELANASSSSTQKKTTPKKRGRKKKKKNYYFSDETESELVKYLNSDCQETKNKIFTKHLYYPFYKMSENLIHTFKFYYTEVDDLEDLKHELIIFFLERLHKWDPTKGFKAFSYFSIAGKRYLINYNNKNYAKLIQKADVDETDNDYSISREGEIISNRDATIAFFPHFIEYVDDNLFTLFTKEKEQQVASAFLMVFKRRKNPDMLFNKKALWIYIREITGLSEKETPILTKVVKKFKKVYEDLFNTYYQKGCI
jgi:hypothetical protein